MIDWYKMITSADCLVWHIARKDGKLLCLLGLSVNDLSIKSPEMTGSMALSGILPRAESLFDIMAGDTLEVHCSGCGRMSEYHRDNVYMSLFIVDTKPVSINNLCDCCPPETPTEARLILYGHFEINRRLPND